jgi:hypothetical protein
MDTPGGIGSASAGEVMAAGVDGVYGIRIIAPVSMLIDRSRVMRVTRALGAMVVHAGSVLVALEGEPRHCRGLDGEPGQQH